MKVVITGGTGFIGEHLTQALEGRGDDVIVVSRSETGPGVIQWNPLQPGSLELPDGTDAVIHLAGAPLFGRRWNEDYKQTIRRSRIEGTRTVVQAIKDADFDVDCFLSSSAVGYYGDRGDETLTEDSPPGGDFLARLCEEWEDLALEAGSETPTRTAVMRLGMVLGRDGGALPQMLNPVGFIKPFHWGLGGPLGDGSHFMAWVHIRDVVGMILYLLDRDLSGPFNLTAPNPVRNREFTRTLGSVLNRPTLLPVPKFGLRLLYGEAVDVLYASQRVVPRRLQQAGYSFQFERINPALAQLLQPGRPGAEPSYS